MFCAAASAPDRGLEAIGNGLASLEDESSYLHHATSSHDRFLFRPKENTTSAINRRASGFSDEQVRERVREVIRQKLATNDDQVFHTHFVFQPQDEIKIDSVGRTLVVLWPTDGVETQIADICAANKKAQNAVLFLSGDVDQVESVVRTARKVRGAEAYREELTVHLGKPVNDPEVEIVQALGDRARSDLDIAIKGTFYRIWFQTAKGITRKDLDSRDDGQQEKSLPKRVQNCLDRVKKWSVSAGDIDDSDLRTEIEDLVFGKRPNVPESEIREVIASRGDMVWGPPGTWEKLRDEMIARGHWYRSEGFICRADVGVAPSVKPEARLLGGAVYSGASAVLTVAVANGDKIEVRHGDDAHAELVPFKTGAGSVTFPTKSSRVHITALNTKTGARGDEQSFPVVVRVEDQWSEDGETVTFANVPQAPLRISFDGSDPRDSSTMWNGSPVRVPADSIRVLASADGQPPVEFAIPKPQEAFEIKRGEAYTLSVINLSGKSKVFKLLEALRNRQTEIINPVWRIEDGQQRWLAAQSEGLRLSPDQAISLLSSILGLYGDRAEMGLFTARVRFDDGADLLVFKETAEGIIEVGPDTVRSEARR